ncbi:uncharacterized protein K452DRAFT_305812 [Aplosporella prunicola CBS 121167]|uniref:Uncharacterized protein n=1 Tax=Aplosporella prunicola CBS 121167 TaxID=1176127 RepID=A0A6A6BNM9_9PEZI|nr:uncharacterized protein K452DRAFT_305812 [Aplosporella prunicola CBS 121167]KAF2144844.1 hypothetical protein K452DRAFT_305812 [Aplosporella prunicola CBS 121167]
MPLKVVIAPNGWTVDEDEMSVEEIWGQDGDGTMAARELGLTDLKPQMVKSRIAGGDVYLFTAAGGRCYFWNMLENTILECVYPKGLENILDSMWESDTRNLEFRAVG